MVELYHMRIECKENYFYWTSQAVVCALSARQHEARRGVCNISAISYKGLVSLTCCSLISILCS